MGKKRYKDKRNKKKDSGGGIDRGGMKEIGREAWEEYEGEGEKRGKEKLNMEEGNRQWRRNRQRRNERKGR